MDGIGIHYVGHSRRGEEGKRRHAKINRILSVTRGEAQSKAR